MTCSQVLQTSSFPLCCLVFFQTFRTAIVNLFLKNLLSWPKWFWKTSALFPTSLSCQKSQKIFSSISYQTQSYLSSSVHLPTSSYYWNSPSQSNKLHLPFTWLWQCFSSNTLELLGCLQQNWPLHTPQQTPTPVCQYSISCKATALSWFSSHLTEKNTVIHCW